MKKIYCLMLMVGGALGCSAALQTALQVELRGGEKTVYFLAEGPQVTFDGADMQVLSGDTEARFVRADVLCMTFVEQDYEALSRLENGAAVRLTRGSVECPGAAIAVFDCSGSLLLQGRDALSLNSLPAGMYLVRAGHNTFKINR